VACTFLLTGLWLWHRSAARDILNHQKTVLAVLPFDNLSHDPDQEFFSDGLTEEMIAQLSHLNPERLAVIARGSVLPYKGTRLAMNQVGRELHADYLVQGSVRRDADHVRITVQLIQVSDQTDVWTQTYDRQLKDILQLQDSVAGTIANQIHVTLTPDQRTGVEFATTVNPAAYDAYLKGRYYWNKRTVEGLEKGAQYFQEAVNEDPSYGAAYSGLADSNSGLAWHGFRSPSESLPTAYAAAQKAIEIDPRSAEAHASLGLVLLHKWDWAGAETELRRALQLNPRYANAHHWYGDYLSIRGRHDEAVLEARQALELDPLNLMIGTWLGLRYYLARRYNEAVKQSQATVDLDANFAAAHLVLGESYLQMRMYRQGIAELQKAGSLSGNSPIYLAQVAVGYALAGEKSEALRTVATLQELSHKRYVSPYGFAQIYAALNDKEQTYRWLEAAYSDHAVWMSYLSVDPVFNSMRSDKRFQSLLHRVGLP
jgi:TolB-like protein/Flp pilus assembly protein TadD